MDNHIENVPIFNGKNVTVKDIENSELACEVKHLENIKWSDCPIFTHIYLKKDHLPSTLLKELNLVDDSLHIMVWSESKKEITLDINAHEGSTWRNNMIFGSVGYAIQSIVASTPTKYPFQLETDSDWLTIKFDHQSFGPNASLKTSVDQCLKLLEPLFLEAELRVSGTAWDSLYEKDETIFTKQIVVPLLTQMGFDNVRYNHGVFEYGRDVLFTEIDRFGNRRLLAAQVKAGKVSGGANSLVDTIVGQIDDAFAMKIRNPTDALTGYISEFFVITSGRFTDNAEEKIQQKMPQRLVGCVTFLDGKDIQHLLQKHFPH